MLCGTAGEQINHRKHSGSVDRVRARKSRRFLKKRSASGVQSQEGTPRTIENSDYCPWDFCPYRISIGSLEQQRRKHNPPSGPDRAFGKALQEFRKARNVSQEKLALDAGFDRTFVSLLERGLRSPTMRTLIALSAELDVRPSEIVQRMEELLP